MCLIYHSVITQSNSAALATYSFFFCNDTATPEIYTLSLHDALPILRARFGCCASDAAYACAASTGRPSSSSRDRKSTRLNFSHGYISYAVFCLKKKKKKKNKKKQEESDTEKKMNIKYC